MCAVMTPKSCAVEMRNAILGNHLKAKEHKRDLSLDISVHKADKLAVYCSHYYLIIVFADVLFMFSSCLVFLAFQTEIRANGSN